jgi:pimeloyl-ACP methyl ester carboxylesterase
MPQKVTSKGGTEIAYTRAGAGPPLVLVDGALCDRAMGPNANRLSSISRLALYELPYVVDDSRPPIPSNWAGRLSEMAATDRRADAVRYFMRDCIGVPRPIVAVMRFMPAWPKLKAVAHTLPYDARIVGDLGGGAPLPAGRWAHATVPALVVAGGESPASMKNAMRALADVLPSARYQTLAGQTHVVKPARLAPVLSEFFTR